METKSIIQANVNVIRLVNLKKGDVFKRIEKSSYGSDGIWYDVVVDIMNDGENTYLEIIEYKKSFDGVEATTKVFSGVDDIAIFPVTLSEVKEYFEAALTKLTESIDDDKEKLENKIQALEKAKKFTKGELSKELSEAEFKNMPQLDYNKQIKDKESKIKELQEENGM